MAQAKWDDLKKRSENYLASAEAIVASGNKELLQNALENMHLALELAMKAVIAKNGERYPDFGKEGHNLESLILQRFGLPQTSILAMAKQANKTSLANIGLSAWSMDCRYIYMENFEDMKYSINCYKGLYIWIKEELLK